MCLLLGETSNFHRFHPQTRHAVCDGHANTDDIASPEAQKWQPHSQAAAVTQACIVAQAKALEVVRQEQGRL